MTRAFRNGPLLVPKGTATPASLARAAVFCLLSLAACAHDASPVRLMPPGPDVGRLSAFEAPACGARIFVAMGVNRKYPTDEKMRISQGDLYLQGSLVATVSKKPEIAVLDVPAGETRLSWMPSRYDTFERGKTKQNDLVLTLAEGATAFVVLDWYDDTPAMQGLVSARTAAAAIAFRTEAVDVGRSDDFEGRKIAFHLPLTTPCARNRPVVAAIPAQPPPQVQSLQSPPAVVPLPPPPPPAEPLPQTQTKAVPAPVAPIAPALPQIAKAAPDSPSISAPPSLAPAPPPSLPLPPPLPPQQASLSPPDSSVVRPPSPDSGPPAASGRQQVPRPDQAQQPPSDPLAFAEFYYVVNARRGAPAYAEPKVEKSPLYTFANAATLNVVEVSADLQWLKVVIPGGRTGFVSSEVVTKGIKALPDPARGK